MKAGNGFDRRNGGKLRFDVRWNGRCVETVAVAPRSLPSIERLLKGRTGSEALRLVPMLYSLCGGAQDVAAGQAYDATREAAIAPETVRKRAVAVLGEALHEHCWRMLLDWPGVFDLEAAPAVFKRIRTVLTELEIGGNPMAAAARLEELVSREVLGVSSHRWLAAESAETWWRLAQAADTLLAAMVRRMAAGEGAWGDSDVPLLPSLSEAEMRDELGPAILDDSGFAECPQRRGKVFETGALARMATQPAVRRLMDGEGNSVRVRMLARIAEVVALPGRIRGAIEEGCAPGWVKAVRLAPGQGLSWVETARGVLMHVIEICEGRIGHYRIVAPTEWNFHPGGACVRGLRACAAGDETTLRRRIAEMVMVVDPCVDFEVNLNHA